MSFIKIGEALDILNVEATESCVASVDETMLNNFKKTALELKKIAPKADDFLYFSAVMMTSAEASALNEDGSPKLNSKGEKVEVGWDKSGGTWKWKTNDRTVLAYKNSNGDIFPEEELLKAYKKWIHKPLCIDHKSSSVDHTRGFIVDTYYDRKLKRVIALCALDKANYPDLARKVKSGMQTNVSMGTAVGKAICYDCGTVAKVEADFCDHMRRKSCYGEINIDLNPIELSIVVNGADPRANIKHIIASADRLNSYVESKAQEIHKFADNFKATISFIDNSGGATDNKVTNVDINSGDLESFKKDVQNAIEEFQSLQDSLKDENLENDMLSGNDSVSNKESDENHGEDSFGLAPPHERFASDHNFVYSKLNETIVSIEKQINKMSQDLRKLYEKTDKQEENMSGSNEMNKKGYFQGTEEPTPGKSQYTSDPLNNKLRDDGDRQMDTVDTGPVDGMFPGDLDRKKMVARAEAEERALKRAAIVNMAKEALEKKSYYNNGEGSANVNTPTPGKTKYVADKLEKQLRDEEVRQTMKNKNMGPLDGEFPGDKERRAKHPTKFALNGKFIQAKNADGSPNLGKSSWDIFAGDKLVLSASVSDLSGGRSDLASYNSIATTEFGTKVMQNIKSFGAEGFKAIMKSAQVAPPPVEAPMPPMAEEAAPVDSGADGDPKQTALELSEEVKDKASDLNEAVRALTGEQAEMGEVAPDGMGAMASFNSARKEINSALTVAMKEVVAQLADHAQELEMIVNMYDKGSVTSQNQEVLNSVVEDAIIEAKASVNDAFGLMTAFVSYADGTQKMVKRAEMEASLKALAAEEGDDSMNAEDDTQAGDDLMSLISDTDSELGEVENLLHEDHDHDHLGDLTDEESLQLSEELDEDLADATVSQQELDQVKLPAGSTVTVTAGFESKAERAAMRAKLAAETVKMSPILHDAHPKGGTTIDLDIKPSLDLARFEDLEEVHDVMMDVATAPVKVRKEAEAIHQLISKGELSESDLPALVAEGLDKAAVAYWKTYYSQLNNNSEFTSELVKEHVKAEMEAELNLYKVKLARSYELAYEMVDRGLCGGDRVAVSDQVDSIMKCNDDSFETLKRVVARHAPLMQKQAGRMPNVGVLNDGFSGTPAQSEFEQLSQVFSKPSKRGSF